MHNHPIMHRSCPKTSNVVSPCIRLNDDVLQEIFIRCVSGPERSFVLDYKKHSIRKAPQLSVSWVCSSWRNIALLTPQLWNRLTIFDLTEVNLSIAGEYLSRAGNVPVSIELGRPSSAPGEDFHPNLTNFLSSYRLRSLWFHSHLLPLHLFLPSLPQQNVADLESLLICSTRDSEEALLDLNDTRYPKLAVVDIHSIYRISGFTSSLRKFVGANFSMTVSECWDLLSRCPSLEEADLKLTPDRIRPISVPQIHLQHLRSLAFYDPGSMNAIPFDTFMEALSLPSLERLPFTSWVAWSTTAFQSLAHRSNYFPCLKNFNLVYPTSDVDAGALLEAMPSLECIYMCCGMRNKAIFDQNTLDDLASGSLAPRLHTLIVGSISNADLFVDMVETRTKNAQMSSNGIPAPFKEVVFDGLDQGYGHESKGSSRLYELRLKGVEIRSQLCHF